MLAPSHRIDALPEVVERDDVTQREGSWCIACACHWKKVFDKVRLHKLLGGHGIMSMGSALEVDPLLLYPEQTVRSESNAAQLKLL